MSVWSLTDGTNTVSFYPTYKGYMEGETKYGDVGKTSTGRRFEYVYGTALAWNFQIMFVNSSDKYNLNNWFQNGTHLSLTPGYTSAVTTVAISKGRPVTKPIDPYEDQFLAKVSLEEVK